jgi:hypothetical protein
MDELIWTFDQLSDWDNDGKFFNHTAAEKEPDFNKSYKLVKINHKGLKKHHDRIDNGLRLFGKYYRSLWD